MGKLPRDVSGRKVVKVLQKIGYRVVHRKGSHIRMRDDTNPNHLPVTVPDHKSIKPGLLRQILRNANLTVEEFLRLLRSQKP
ncbi:MAG: type II toxin-antitoxin system HicA family toxin [Candidatus Fervidibacter sacchari]